MGLACSTFYDEPEDVQLVDEARLVERMREICAEWPAYGYRRVTAELHGEGRLVNHKKVMRLMKENGLTVRPRRRFVATTDSDHGGPIFPNLAENVVPANQNQLWVADITYIAIATGFVYLAAILDAWSRRGEHRAARHGPGQRRRQRLSGLDYFTAVPGPLPFDSTSWSITIRRSPRAPTDRRSATHLFGQMSGMIASGGRTHYRAMLARSLIIACAWLALAPGAAAQNKTDEPVPAPETASPASEPPIETTESICLLIESAALANGLPAEFFARVIWRESHYNPNAVGPLTRSGQRAQGIGQFMPATATERRLLDPFDPVEALPKSAEFLSELRGQFGNLGLAAAAYNAGPQRVRAWLAGRRTLPRETRSYVRAVTGRSADEWAATAPNKLDQKNPTAPPCKDLTIIVKHTPNTFVAELERRVSEGAGSPWGVQLGAGFSRSKVLARYAEIERRFRTVLAGHDPMIIRSRLFSSGISEFYQVRVGAETRTEADKLCADLRVAGGHCMVLRNPAQPRGG
jgi:hypothetical protein